MIRLDQLHTNFALLIRAHRSIHPLYMTWICEVCLCGQHSCRNLYLCVLGTVYCVKQQPLILESRTRVQHGMLLPCMVQYYRQPWCTVTTTTAIYCECVQYYRWLTEQRCLAWTLWSVLVEWHTAPPAHVTPSLHHWRRVCKCRSGVDKDNISSALQSHVLSYCVCQRVMHCHHHTYNIV